MAGVTHWFEQGELRSAAACPLGIQQHLAGASGCSSSGEEPRSASCGGRSSQLPTAQRGVVRLGMARGEHRGAPWCSGPPLVQRGRAAQQRVGYQACREQLGRLGFPGAHGGAAPASSSLLWRLAGWPRSKLHGQRLGASAAWAEQRAEQRRRLDRSAQRPQHAQRRATRTARRAWPGPISGQQAHRGTPVWQPHVRGSPRTLLPPCPS